MVYTSPKPCSPTSLNWYIAGMESTTAYAMNYEVITGTSVVRGPATLPFTTGAIAADVPLPDWRYIVRPSAASDLSARIQLTNYNTAPPALTPYIPVAYDIVTGKVVWYYRPAKVDWPLLTRPLPGGTMLTIVNGFGTGTGALPPTSGLQLQQVLREYDLAGNVIRETNSDRVSEQLVSYGIEPLGRFNHEAIRLPGGLTMVLADNQRIYPAGTQGYDTEIAVIGAVLVLLDRNWQVVWAWNAFDHSGPQELNINRRAIRGEVCGNGGGTTGQVGCPPYVIADVAPDWLHLNSIQYLPDQNLLISMRNQDWLAKIDFRNGRGTGNVIWKMGGGGDFQINSTDPYPWFSGQHEAAFEDPSMTRLTVFDNGNTRVEANGGNSRGQVFTVNVAAKTVTPLVNVDLGVFAFAVGSAQPMTNGNFMFNAGWNDVTNPYQRCIEVTPAGTPGTVTQGNAPAYRSWRMRDLYNPPIR